MYVIFIHSKQTHKFSSRLHIKHIDAEIYESIRKTLVKSIIHLHFKCVSFT